MPQLMGGGAERHSVRPNSSTPWRRPGRGGPLKKIFGEAEKHRYIAAEELLPEEPTQWRVSNYSLGVL